MICLHTPSSIQKGGALMELLAVEMSRKKLKSSDIAVKTTDLPFI